jgi:hypothetical protein
MKHIYFSECLEGPALEWYCNDLEYRAKVYWDMLSAAFDSRWKPTTSNFHAVEVIHAIEALPNSKPPDFTDIRQQYINYHIAHQHRVAMHAPALSTQTTTTTISAPANTATPAIYETTTPTATDSNSTTSKIRQGDNAVSYYDIVS